MGKPTTLNRTLQRPCPLFMHNATTSFLYTERSGGALDHRWHFASSVPRPSALSFCVWSGLGSGPATLDKGWRGLFCAKSLTTVARARARNKNKGAGPAPALQARQRRTTRLFLFEDLEDGRLAKANAKYFIGRLVAYRVEEALDKTKRGRWISFVTPYWAARVGNRQMSTQTTVQYNTKWKRHVC